MFREDGINALYTKHRPALETLVEIGAELKRRFYAMDDPVDGLLLAAASGESMLMIGPPGTAKSRLIRAFCHLLGLIDDDDLAGARAGPDGETSEVAASPDYFEYLLTPFTEPSELFGFYDISKLEKQGLVRIEENMMQKARVVFLDEIFNASGAILNSLLTFMNERRFHDRGKLYRVPLRLLVGATNTPPQDKTLAAVYDRFLLRVWIDNTASLSVHQAALADLLEAGWSETHATPARRQASWAGLLGDLETFQQDLGTLTDAEDGLAIDREHAVIIGLTDLVRNMVKFELSEMSNRRIIKMAGLVLCRALLRAAKSGAETVSIHPGDLDVITRFSLDKRDDHAISKIREDLKELGGAP